MAGVVHEHPALLDLANLTSLPDDEIAAIRRSIPIQDRRRAAFSAILGSLPELSYPPSDDPPLAEIISEIGEAGR